jgi:signal peptidase II
MFARRHSQTARIIGFGTVFLVFLADQLSKLWVLRGLDLNGPASSGQIEILPFFNLTMVWNMGISFGLFPAENTVMRVVFIVFSVAVSIYLASWIWRSTRQLQAIACGMIIGGALGNALDRIIHGAVADFLDFSGLYFPWVFNIADAAISVGVVLLLLDFFIHGEDGK